MCFQQELAAADQFVATVPSLTNVIFDLIQRYRCGARMRPAEPVQDLLSQLRKRLGRLPRHDSAIGLMFDEAPRRFMARRNGHGSPPWTLAILAGGGTRLRPLASRTRPPCSAHHLRNVAHCMVNSSGHGGNTGIRLPTASARFYTAKSREHVRSLRQNGRGTTALSALGRHRSCLATFDVPAS